MKDELKVDKREQADRMMTAFAAVVLMQRLSVVTARVAQGRYHEAYKACGEVEQVLYQLQFNCQDLDEKYNNE
jgi:hypothetical protein